MKRHIALPALLAIGALGCAPKSELDVEFDMIRVSSDIRSLRPLAISRGEGLGRNEMKDLVKRLRSCRAARQITTINRYVHSTQRDPDKLAKDLKDEIGRWNEAKTTNAVLAIKVIKDDEKVNLQDVDLVSFAEPIDHEWQPAYGYDYTERFGFSGNETFAPKLNTTTYGITLRRTRYDMKIQYLIYNTKTQKIMVLDTVDGRAAINNYSQAPAMTAGNIKSALTASLVDRLVNKLCPVPRKKSERQLVALEDPKDKDYTVNEGIELADDNKWDQAASKWRTALAKDKESPYIANNLGVYAERNGNLEEAARYYLQAEKGKNSPRIPSGYYEDVLNEFAIAYKFRDSEARIHAVMGTNSAYVLGGQAKKLKVGATYPVYRVKHIRSPGKAADGLEYTEVGMVEIEKIEKGAIPLAKVRIKESISPLEIEIGDLLYTKPVETPSAPKGPPAKTSTPAKS